MEQATSSLLFDLDGFRVAEVMRNPVGVRIVTIVCVQPQGCPDCGTVPVRVHSTSLLAVRDLPFGQPWQVF